MKNTSKLISKIIIGLSLINGFAFAQPVASFTVSSPISCLGDTLIFTNTSSGAMFYSWDFGDGTTSTSLNPIHVYSTFGPHNIMLVVGDTGQVQDTAFLSIQVSQLPTVNAGQAQFICSGESVQLQGMATGGPPPMTFLWTPSAGLSCTTCNNPVASPTVTTTYTLQATNTSGCRGDGSVFVEVNPSTDFYGHVSSPTANVNTGSVVIFKQNNLTAYPLRSSSFYNIFKRHRSRIYSLLN